MLLLGVMVVVVFWALCGSSVRGVDEQGEVQEKKEGIEDRGQEAGVK